MPIRLDSCLADSSFSWPVSSPASSSRAGCVAVLTGAGVSRSSVLAGEISISIAWDIWILHVTCALNTQINSTTGETPHYMLFGEDKILPYSLLESEPRLVYNYDDFILTRINKLRKFINASEIT